MLPLRDNIPSRTTPFVNYAMITACAIVFVSQLADAKGKNQLVEQYAMIPARVLNPEQEILVTHMGVYRGRLVRVERPAASPPFNNWVTLATCIFLHGGWMHFLGNMWILYIFGDNVEDRIGHVGYLLFYMACGVAASGAHLATNLSSSIPTLGASGAIAGVMGAYFLLYPRAQVLSLVPLFGFAQIVVLPAPTFLGIWFLMQFFQGTMSITTAESGGVAWWAHIGGFVMGFIVAAFLRAVGETRPPVTEVRPNTDRPKIYRNR